MKGKWLVTLVFAGFICCLALWGGKWSDVSVAQTIPTIPTLPAIEDETIDIGPDGGFGCYKPFPMNPSVRLCVYVPMDFGGSKITLSNPSVILPYPPLTPVYMMGQPFNFTFSITSPQPYIPPLIFYMYYENDDVVADMSEPFLKFWVFKNDVWSPLASTVNEELNVVDAAIYYLDTPTTFAVFDAGTRKHYLPILYNDIKP